MNLRLPGTLALLLLVVAAASAGAADSEPRVTRIEPARSGDLLVCRLATDGLPGERILSTLSSGLESSIEIHLELTRGDDVQVRRRYDLRLAFDLWEEIYFVRIGAEEARFADVAQLCGYLAELPPLAVAHVDELQASAAYRVTAGLKLHPLAPAARGRMEEVVTGNEPGRRTGDAGQEVSVSMGRLIRFFYRGGGHRGDLVGVFVSSPFTGQELSDVPD